MALTKITCPHCKIELKPPKPVPEGTRLKCPKCKKGFTAGQDEDDLLIRLDDEEDAPKKAGGIVEEVAEPTDKKKKAVDAIDVLDVLEDDSAPVKKKEPPKKAGAEKKAPPKAEKKEEKKPETKPVVDDDGPGTTYGLAAGDEEEEEEESPRGKKGGGGGKKKKKPEIDHAPDTSVKDPRGPAQEKVILCTNYMLMSAIAGFFGYLGLIVVIMIPAATPLTVDQGVKDAPVEILNVNGGLGGGIGQGGGGGPKMEKESREQPSIFTVFGIDMGQFSYYGLGYFILILLPLVLGMVYSCLIAYGSVLTQSLESRPWGIAGSIMTMIPYQIGGLAILLCWIIEILLIGVLDNDVESTRNMQYGVLALLIVSEIAAGAYVLVVLLQEDVKAGFEYVPEG